MCVGARSFRIRGNDVRSAMMRFDFGNLKKYRKDSRLCLSTQSTGTSEPWEAGARTEKP